ncbi:MAG TPA: glycerol-3-phosphate acyltransferase [Anaerolineae bacterium]|nr:glycerol-3-phosphate acyltransferase [Anaerolineae bacterium]
MQTLIATLLTFLLGAIPFSPLIGRYILNQDIRTYGDKNPGATNVYRAGGLPWYIIALSLDITKGALPLGLAYHIFHWHDPRIIPLALAPSLGHAFSPFLNFQGGKAIAATFGVWIGLTIWTIPLISLVSLVILTLLITPSGWALLGTLTIMFISLTTFLYDPILLTILTLQTILLIYTHRADLKQRPHLRHHK